MPNPFLPLVKRLAPRLDGKQDDENGGEKSTLCNNMTVKYLVAYMSVYFHAQYHLTDEKSPIAVFPTTRKCSQMPAESLYGDMIQCDKCEHWYHIHCVGFFSVP